MDLVHLELVVLSTPEWHKNFHVCSAKVGTIATGLELGITRPPVCFVIFILL